MATQRSVCLIALFLVFLCSQGCEGPLAGLIASQHGPAWKEPTWGEAVEGLQCRLQPDKRVWQAGDTPTFKMDIRNQGERMFALPPSHLPQLCEIQVDGRWYYWPEPVRVDSSVWPLAPGLQFDDIPITLHRQFGINIHRGNHIIRVALSLEGIQVVSNPVGIKVLPAD